MENYGAMKTGILYIGGDHAGFQLKAELIKVLEEDYDVQDLGPYSEERCDYPDVSHALAEKVLEKQSLGILICGSANGVCMAANKHQGIRAAIAWKAELAELARTHNDANVLCLPARFIDAQEAKDTVEAFLNSSFEGGRHEIRVEKIDLV